MPSGNALKKKLSPFAGLVLLLVITIVSLVWALALVDSLFAYRSPLQANPPQPEGPLAKPVTRRVVLVIVDALRLDTSLDAGVMPFLNHLRSIGASAEMRSQPPSYSQQGYATLLSGAGSEINDVPLLNAPFEAIRTFTQDDIFSAAQRAGLKTAVAGFNWFEKMIPRQAVDDSFYTPGEDATADRAVVDAALPWLRSGEQTLVLIHLDQVDYAGHHAGGALSPGWKTAARNTDDLLKEITAELDLAQDTLIVVSDHGQIDRGGHGGNEAVTLREPLVLAGKRVIPGQYPGVRMVDIAPSISALLGTNYPASAQGRLLEEMLSLPEDLRLGASQAAQAQQKKLLLAYAEANHRPLSQTRLSQAKSVPEYQALMEQMRDERLRLERVLRAVPVALGLALVLFWLRRFERRDLVWALLCAAGMIAVFHLRYALLDRYTYSFSSIADEVEFMVYTGSTSSVLFGLAWLAYALKRGLLRLAPVQALQKSVRFCLVCICILLVPAAWSTFLNGALVTWSVPEFTSVYLQLLALTQALFVALSGLLLAGLSALIAGWRGKATAR